MRIFKSRCSQENFRKKPLPNCLKLEFNICASAVDDIKESNQVLIIITTFYTDVYLKMKNNR
jgi:hypothetical protein